MSGIKERLRRIREVIDRLPPCASELANATERLRSRYTVALDLQCQVAHWLTGKLDEYQPRDPTPGEMEEIRAHARKWRLPCASEKTIAEGPCLPRRRHPRPGAPRRAAPGRAVVHLGRGAVPPGLEGAARWERGDLRVRGGLPEAGPRGAPSVGGLTNERCRQLHGPPSAGEYTLADAHRRKFDAVNVTTMKIRNLNSDLTERTAPVHAARTFGG